MVAVVIEDNDGVPPLSSGGDQALACLGNALRGGQIDGGEILDFFGGFPADDELPRRRLAKRQAAERDGSNNR
jgi:hypothetical protein